MLSHNLEGYDKMPVGSKPMHLSKIGPEIGTRSASDAFGITVEAVK
jgi:hypothetical protein